MSLNPRIELICFGTELLKDKINTNINTIAERLFTIGLPIQRAVTVGDDAREIELSLREAIGRSNIVITSGGLGPTFDDLTRECVAKVLCRPLKFSRPILKQIEQRFQRAGLPMPEENKRQADVISGAKVILNSVGTAPGQIIPTAKGCLIILPGPPKELIPMLNSAVCPYLKKKYSRKILRSLVLHIFGYPESEIDELIQPVVEKNWDEKNLKVTFGILAHDSIIDVKVSVEGKNISSVQKVLSAIQSELYEILGDKVYGENEETMESVIGKLLTKRKETLAAAESCTGGLVANKITDISGSSNYFKEGVVVYSNESKERLLGVRHKTLKKFGAVSEPVAREMAQGILKRAKSDWGISITGIAGPAGGTKQKPVGTVCFGLASRDGIETCTRHFFGSRKEIKEKSALMSLDLVRRKLLKGRK